MTEPLTTEEKARRYDLAPKLFNVVRVFKDSNRRTLVAERVTEEEAQRHCRNPETSSSTCTNAEGLRRTQRSGPWFDLYDAR